MRTLSIRLKLIALSSSLILILVVVGGIEFFGGRSIVRSLKDISDVQFPAVRSMSLADMMHDGLKAVVYQAWYVGENGDAQAKQDVVKEAKQVGDDLRKYIREIEALPLNEDTKAAIEASKPKIEAYAAAAESIVLLAVSGQRAKAKEDFPQFDAAFSNLEVELARLGDLIEKDSERSRNEGSAISSSVETAGFIFVTFGVLVGVVLSFFIIQGLVRSMSRVMHSIQQSSNELLSVASQSADSALSLGEGATQQSSSLQQTLASVEEISAMAAQNSASASSVSQAVELNQEATNEGAESVRAMVSSIQEIKLTTDEILEQMEGSNKEFGEIVKIISMIDSKTRVINDIVFQTKLLSFNASVEAARAGEHGRGFAVVAEEVGNLAQMSGSAAKEITNMLSASIAKVNEIVQMTSQKIDQLVEVGKDKIASGESKAVACLKALDKISQNAEHVRKLVGEITSASKEQSQGVGEIGKSMTELDQIAQKNSKSAVEVSAQAEQLRLQSTSLSESVRGLAEIINGADEVHRLEPPRNPPVTMPSSHTEKTAQLVSLSRRRAR